MSFVTKTNRVPYQFKNATKLNTLLDGIYTEVDTDSIGNLTEYFNYNAASGVWLSQLASLFNVKKSYSGVIDAFILGLSTLGSSDVLGGIQAPISDLYLRNLLIARIYVMNATVLNIDYFYTIFTLVFPSLSYIKITNGDKVITIDLTFDDISERRMLVAFNEINPTWFGVPNGTAIIFNYL